MVNWLFATLDFFKYLLTALVLYGIFAVFEWRWPAERGQSAKNVWFNLQWYFLYSLIGLGMASLGLNLVVDRLRQWCGGSLVTIGTLNAAWQYVLAGLIYFLLTDFFYYWFHRGQHQIAFLWEQHQLHHSDRALNVTSTRRVHWLEDPLVILFVGIPVGLLLQIEGLEMGILAFIELLWLQFIHMNLRLELGPLTRWVVGPQHHRVHHSYLPQHVDRNFAVFSPIWDRLFGTYCPLLPGEFPATGLASGETHDRLGVALILPLKAWFSQKYWGRLIRQLGASRDRIL